MRRNLVRRVRVLPTLLTLIALLFGASAAALAQGTGTVQGTVTRMGEGSALSGVSVGIKGTNLSAVTGASGRYQLQRVPAGPQVLQIRWFGYRMTEVTVDVVANTSVTADAELEAAPIPLGELVVEGVSRTPERIVEAPAAVSVVEPRVLENASITGQAGLALATVPGVDVVQSGVNDFNVNARGLNSTLNRRVLVLQDGRDLSIAFLGAQEWNGLSVPLEDLRRVEMVRGPGSALYGANAFSGVVNIVTPSARQIIGTKVTVGGGELETYRADVRQAGLLGEGRFGYRVNGGYSRNDTYSRSRTNPGSLAAEYADATTEPVTAPSPGFELRPLNGQSIAGIGAPATGDRDALSTIYGSGRLDYYLTNGSIFTVDGGATQVENELFVTGIGRVQVTKAVKPWVRAAWAADRFNLMAWYTGRDTKEPQYSLASGLPLLEESGVYHVEGQANQNFLGDQGRVVVGASYRLYNVNTSGTLMNLANDDRSDSYYSGYGQAEYKLLPQLRAVGALRYDEGDLYDGQWSPKGALVFSPNDDHSFRLTYNQAFQVPNYSEFFLQVERAGQRNLLALETALRANPQLGPALNATVPVGQLYTNSAAVPVAALGNAGLDVEKVKGWEIGYKGNISGKAYVSVDLFLSKIENFVTDLIPLNASVNPDIVRWTAPQALQQASAAAAAAVEAASLAQVPSLTRRPNGNSAIAISYTNAGQVKQRGVEFGFGYRFTPEVRFDGSYTFFDTGYFEDNIQGLAPGDVLEANTPQHKAMFSLAYTGAQGFDAEVSLRMVDGMPWAAGVFQGYVPASETVNLSAGYQINNNFRIHAIATNLFDQQRFQLYGGSVIGRRILGGLAATF